MGLETTLCGIGLDHPVMNAAGTCKHMLDVRRFADSVVSAIVLGSMTVERRPGNDGNVFWAGPNARYALNSLGLPNPGAAAYNAGLAEMKITAERAGKPLVVSVAGFRPGEYAYLAAIADRNGADLIELNLGCPNVWQDGEQKRIACFDPQLVDEITFAVADRVDMDAIIGVKLSPVSDPSLLVEVAAVLTERSVDFVTTSNTFPNAFAWQDVEPPVGLRHPAISVGYGGMSGAALKPIALGQVRQLREALPDMIDLIGVGGITSGEDVRDYLDAGATAVQAATPYFTHGEDPSVYGDILMDLTD